MAAAKSAAARRAAAAAAAARQRRRRQVTAPTIAVDAGSDQFTIEVRHGGFFIGYGQLRSYVDGKVDWFDNADADTWSTLWFEDFVQLLGYQQQPSLKFYWLLPERDLSDGLRIIVGDQDTILMAQVSSKVKNLVVYFDHQDNMGGVDWDDIVANPGAPLPKVISPKKVEVIPKKVGEKLPVFYTDLKKGRVEQNAQTTDDPDSSESEELEFFDSDNEVHEDDADLFEGLIDARAAKPKGNKKAKGSKLKPAEVNRPIGSDDEESEGERLQLPHSDSDDEEGYTFQSFVEEDMNNPSFYVGLTFSSVQKLREAITEYSVKN
ncbi:hypothetical protein BS78_05G177800 [Paspalum vaginatum]|nr:hypothetical protein BS78_05G177800 [Paspalum vaginatum]